MFYNKFKSACSTRGVSPSSVVKDLGLSSANLSYWKNGRTPKLIVIERIAKNLQMPLSYFTVDDGFSDEDKLKFALFGDTENITDEMFDDVKRYAEFVKEKYKNDNT